MLAALRRAGSALPKHARRRLRELQSSRRCLPAELGLMRRLSAFEQTLCRQSLRGVATLGQMVPEVQIWCAVNLWPCEPLPRRGSHDLSYICR